MNDFYTDGNDQAEPQPQQDNGQVDTSNGSFVYSPIISLSSAINNALSSSQYQIDSELIVGETMGITIVEISPNVVIPVVNVTPIQAEAFTQKVLNATKRYLREAGAKQAQILPPMPLSVSSTQKEAMDELRRHFRVAEKASELASPAMISSMDKVGDDARVIVSAQFKTNAVDSFMESNNTKTVHLSAMVSCVWEKDALNINCTFEPFSCQEDAVLAVMLAALLRENHDSLFKLCVPSTARKKISGSLNTRTFFFSPNPIDMKHVQHVILETCGPNGLHYATTIPAEGSSESYLQQITTAMEANNNGISAGCSALVTSEMNVVNPLSVIWVDTPTLHSELSSTYRTANDRVIGFDTWDFALSNTGSVASYSVAAPFGYGGVSSNR